MRACASHCQTTILIHTSTKTPINVPVRSQTTILVVFAEGHREAAAFIRGEWFARTSVYVFVLHLALCVGTHSRDCGDGAPTADAAIMCCIRT